MPVARAGCDLSPGPNRQAADRPHLKGGADLDSADVKVAAREVVLGHGSLAVQSAPGGRKKTDGPLQKMSGPSPLVSVTKPTSSSPGFA